MKKRMLVLLSAALSAMPLSAQVPQARALADEGRFDDAKRMLLPMKNDPEALLLLSKISMLQADDEAAADFCRKAVALRPMNAEYHYCVGNAARSLVQHSSIFKQPGLSKETFLELNRAIELDPNLLPARFALLDAYLFAPSFAGGSAEKALQQAAEIRRRDAAAGHRAYARIYAHQKKTDLSRKEFLDGVREDPNSARAHTALAAFYGSEDKNYRAAFEEIDAALGLDAAYMPAWFRLGQIAAVSGANLPRGEEALKKYVAYRPTETEPTRSSAFYYLGLVYEKEGKPNEARQSYVAAAKLNPGSKELQEAARRLR